MTSATLVLDECVDGGGTAGKSLKYRLDVLGAGIADVVAVSGGWLFDRVMAGWEVNVLIAEPGDVRPLEILGARAVDLEAALTSTRKRAPHALAVSTDLFERDERIRRDVLAALHAGSSEVTFWGVVSPAVAERTVSQMEHPLTAAACAFKSHALALTGATQAPAGPTERFFSGANSYQTWSTTCRV